MRTTTSPRIRRTRTTGRTLFVAFLFATTVAALPTAVEAQSGEGRGLEEAAPASTADVVYGHKAGMALTFDVLHPTGPANGAGILYMVSGGWFSRWSPPGRTAARFDDLLDRGFTVFAVRHGSAPRFNVPEAHADVDRALRYIRLHADDWGVDVERLGVFGGSAGGHLSLMLGLAPDHRGPVAGSGSRTPEDLVTAAEGDDGVARADDRVAAVVAYYPPVDLRPLVGPNERFPALDFHDSLAADISPILFATPDDPPTLLIHGDADELVPIRNSEIMYEALQEKGVESAFITIPGGDHGFRNAEHRARAEAAMVEWFVEHLD
ncbi:MAG: prolyl oligopeptidase family serine peptidase [Longimicrobiales bacterium]